MNQKSIYARIGATMLCSIVLFSSFGFTLNMHLCQGKVKTFNLLGDAQKCVGMNDSNSCSSNNLPDSFSKTKCCSEASLKADISTQNILALKNQVQNLVLGINPYSKLISAIIPEIESDIAHYNPPPDQQSGRSLLVLHQTFLI